MNQNEYFDSLCCEVEQRLKITKLDLAVQYLGLDPKTLRKYRAEGDIPKEVWSELLSLASGEPKSVYIQAIDNLFGKLTKGILGKGNKSAIK